MIQAISNTPNGESKEGTNIHNQVISFSVMNKQIDDYFSYQGDSHHFETNPEIQTANSVIDNHIKNRRT